ncbi:MAG TPA: hypothetical protein VGG94_04740 [Chthoniobacterales bacterium]|jgi:hypothetical protein
MRVAVGVFLTLAASIVPTRATALAAPTDELYRGWLKMYNLQFEEAQQTFARWKESHPDDPLGPASNAAAFLFSELARLGALEAELFVEDTSWINRQKLSPDPQVKIHFTQEIEKANLLADTALQKSATDANALFAKSLIYGLRADYAALIDQKSLTALMYTRQGAPFADKLLALHPDRFDAYLGPGIENYLFSLKPAPLRVLLRLTGSHTDRATGIEQLKKTAEHGYYFEPFAKLLLAVAALRDNNRERARELLSGLHDRFPGNELYARELRKLTLKSH